MAKIIKPRTESKELFILRLLNTRMNLPEKDRQHFYTLQKGYDGELMFDALTERLQSNCLILNDLLLKVNNTMFQIDTTIIAAETIYYNEVKYYEGDYFYEFDRFFKRPRKEYLNPLHQLNRGESSFRQLVQNLGYHFPIEAKVVFINPEFTLYQAPLDKPFIFPTQVKSYLKKLDTIPSKLNGRHEALAEKLMSLHNEECPYTKLPPYSYDQLRKGITCAACSSFSVYAQGHKCVCGDCGHEEKMDSSVLRNVGEIKLLFPDRKITTNLVYEWCGRCWSSKSISRILGRNYKTNGDRRWVFYD